jgi:hypothetical protein
MRNIMADVHELGFKTTFEDLWENPENSIQR